MIPLQAQDSPHLGYGVDPASADDPGIVEAGFDWTKTNQIPFTRLPTRVLVQLSVDASTLDDLEQWGNTLEASARGAASRVEAYEIGNEPNLDDATGWAAPPDAAAYTELLCKAYQHIKEADPSAIVVSAGLAPTGRVPFDWNGHQGYCTPDIPGCPQYYQDEREFLREMLQHGAAACFDAFGYHPHGFDAPFDAAPGSDACGPNDFCFRGVEKLREILLDEFGVDKPIWATDFGWIVSPNDVGRPECLNDPAFRPFQWMVVSPEAQAENLAGAFEYAEENYPWMRGMFVYRYG
ncbi:MAG: hypothetical protein ACRDIB_11640, partial [Ardenticatenaceae bacterium]